MKKICSKCGEPIKTSRIPIVIIIVESIIIVALIVLLVASIDLANEIIADSNGTTAAEDLVKDINSTPYYNECSWCPNYGYITGAIPTKWEAGYKAAFYVYSLKNEELARYISELEGAFFEKNPFSDGELMFYSRDFNDESQTIAITVSRERNQVTIMAEDESK